MAKHRPNSSKYYNGLYKPKNLDKYIGDPNEVYYRSGWEYKFMVYCDLTDEILRWGSEPYKINYVDINGRQRYYMPDFYLETASKKNAGFVNKFLIEIKPEKEIHEPKIPKTTKSARTISRLEEEMKTWLKNKHKWAYAAEWCKARDIRFWLVTEKHLEELKMIKVPK